ncbi:Na+/H+ antiporter NhaC family protein [Candidatus Palauibacter sp.]|uniref:Na+/H+ antiporter NhaC family protein n=1 Tax=Candidatus Palauibacter sp. TaxID=3101350 RepID=UPI003C702E54
MEHFGAVSLIPTAVVLAAAIATRRPVESLIAGAIVGFVILAPSDPLTAFTDGMVAVMQNETVGWIILVCALFGSLITLLVRVGAAASFGDAASARIRSRGGSLAVTWLLGLVVFIDDYLNVLAVSSSVKRFTDRHRVSREMLAYVVDSTAAPVCILVPISTWAAFFAGLLEDTGWAEPGRGLALYADAIPYMLYAWIAVAMAVLVGIGLVPALGPMRKAERRARETGQVVPPGLEEAALEGDIDAAAAARARPWHFVLPIVTLVAATWLLDLDILKGVVVALGITLIMVVGTRLLRVRAALDTAMAGVLTMIVPLATVFGGFLLKEVNDGLGLTAYLIETVEPLMTPRLLPAVTFLTMSFVAFATASFWGIFAVAIPIVLPLADSVGAEMPLVIGALISASAFGSHACFYGDSTVLAARGAGCGVVEHALTQLPYALFAAALAAGGFLVLA